MLHQYKSLPGLDGEFGEEEDGKKRRRAWELWSLEDKNIFFESINECGKDFEAIQVSHGSPISPTYSLIQVFVKFMTIALVSKKKIRP